MRETVSGSDADCRYLKEDPNQAGGQFSRFIESLGFSLGSDYPIYRLVARGWVTPALRIRIPDAFYEDWENFPQTPRKGKVAPDCSWAEVFFHPYVIFQPFVMFAKNPNAVPTDWYLHPFDILGSDEDIRNHLLDPRESPAWKHLNGQTVHPWIDFFHYWEAYRLIECADVSALHFVLDDEVEAKLQNTIAHLKTWTSMNAGYLERIKREYAQRQRTFDWISRARTADAIAVVSLGRVDHNQAVAGKKLIFGSVGSDPNILKQQLRDDLLQMFWWWDRSGNRPPLAINHLQQDVSRGCDFIRDVTGENVDYRDPTWYIADRMDPGWTPLQKVMPLETWLAREDFPLYATMYLDDLAVFNQWPTKEAALETLMDSWWSRSYPFRRFCVAFHRLHRMISSDPKRFISFDDVLSVDYLVLCSLIVEKLIAEQNITRAGGQATLPSFRDLIRELADRSSTALGIPTVRPILDAAWKDTFLHDLTTHRQLTFVRSMAGASTPEAEILSRTLHNFTIVRNYAAHHDCLDFELQFERIGKIAMDTITTTFIIVAVTS